MSLSNNSTILNNILTKVNNLPSISDSSQLNFKVVGGTTEPSNRTENMIWVNTSTTISGWVFSPTKPTSPSPNSVWICVGSANDAGFNAIMNNGIELYPIAARQYVNGVWVDKVAKSWQNGKWNDWSVWLVGNGVDTTKTLGTPDTLYSNQWVHTNGALQLYRQAHSQIAWGVSPVEYDFTNYSKLFIKVTDFYSGDNTTVLGVSKPGMQDSFISSVTLTRTGDYEIEISQVNQKAGIACSLSYQGCSVTISEMYLG